MSLKDKVAVVTGAGRNIGEAIAHKRLADEGAAIAVVDLDQGRADKVVSDLSGKGVSAAARLFATCRVQSRSRPLSCYPCTLGNSISW